MNILVVTTINPPTPAIRAFGTVKGFELVVVGDAKTPSSRYRAADLTFLSVDDQVTLGFRLVPHVPLNHYCRKNLGYLEAIRRGALVIADTDDDNLPYDTWPQSFKLGTIGDVEIADGPGAVNAYQAFTTEFIWPRGFPLSQVRAAGIPHTRTGPANVLVWQGLADLDPDVDAIHRLVFGQSRLRFKRRSSPLVLAPRAYCPFNSQNTIWARDAFLYLYLPMYVRFRFTDILRSYVAQRGIWEMGGSVAFGNASVYQDRNAHDLLLDLADEIDCYTQTEDVIASLDACELSGAPDRDIRTMYAVLQDKGVVEKKELAALDAWIADVTDLTSEDDG